MMLHFYKPVKCHSSSCWPQDPFPLLASLQPGFHAEQAYVWEGLGRKVARATIPVLSFLCLGESGTRGRSHFFLGFSGGAASQDQNHSRCSTKEKDLVLTTICFLAACVTGSFKDMHPGFGCHSVFKALFEEGCSNVDNEDNDDLTMGLLHARCFSRLLSLISTGSL
jgi:hypothetical protein